MALSRWSWAAFNALQLVFTLMWTAGWIMLALLMMLITRSRRLPLRMAARCWAPGLLRGSGARLVAAIDRAPAVGRDVGVLAGLDASGVLVTDDLDAALEGVDVVIDFTHPTATRPLLEKLRARGIAAVIGTTGFDDEGKAAIARLAAEAPVVAITAAFLILYVDLPVAVRLAQHTGGGSIALLDTISHLGRAEYYLAGAALLLGFGWWLVRRRDIRQRRQGWAMLRAGSLIAGTLVAGHLLVFALKQAVARLRPSALALHGPDVLRKVTCENAARVYGFPV